MTHEEHQKIQEELEAVCDRIRLLDHQLWEHQQWVHNTEQLLEQLRNRRDEIMAMTNDPQKAKA